MISLRDIARRCIGLTGSFSVLRDFYGYTSIPNPLSIVRQARLLRDGKHIVVHPKIIFNPVIFTVDEMMDAMRQLFGDNGIAVIIRKTERLNVPASRLDISLPLDPVSGKPTCNSKVPLSTDQTQLFGNINNVGNNEIVVYFVRNITGFDGCAINPPATSRHSATIDKDAQVWVVAHEVGHNLGLSHPDQASCDSPTSPPSSMTDRLMTCTWLGSITKPPPDLIKSEVDTMNSSSLSTRCK